MLLNNYSSLGIISVFIFSILIDTYFYPEIITFSKFNRVLLSTNYPQFNKINSRLI